MNGFLFYQSGFEPHRSGFEQLISLLGHHPEVSSSATGDVLITWGEADGDVQVYSNAQSSVLILCGYVTEVGQRPELRRREEIGKYLLDFFGGDPTDQQTAALVRELFGSFGIVYHDFKSGLTRCVSDRVASRPLFVCQRRKGWAVTTNANAIACTDPTLQMDPGSLAAFLLYGGPVDPCKTLYKGIKSIASGVLCRLDSSNRPARSSWYRFKHEPEGRFSKSDWLELASERLIKAARRLANSSERPLIFFSGGVDSRLTAAALRAVGSNPMLVTLADARNIEVKVAEKAAHAFGLRYKVIFRDKHWYLRGIPKAVFETSGSFCWSHGHFSGAVSALREAYDPDAFLLGDLCEAFSKLFCAIDRSQTVRWEPKKFADEFDSIRLEAYRPIDRVRTLGVLSSQVREEAEETLRNDIITRYTELMESANDPAIVADQMFRWESVATLPTFFMFFDLRSVAPERNLMLDPDVHSLLEVLPSKYRNGANLGALLIRKFNRAAGAVPNSNTLLPMHWPSIAHRASKQCKPVLGKIRRAIFGDSHRTTGSWPKKVALYTQDPQWQKYFQSHLSEEALQSDLFDVNQVAGYWDSLKAGDQGVAETVERLVQISLLVRMQHSPVTRKLEAVPA